MRRLPVTTASFFYSALVSSQHLLARLLPPRSRSGIHCEIHIGDGAHTLGKLPFLGIDATRGTLVKASQAGQLAWKDIIGRLKEFEYEHEGVVIRWHVAGASSPIIIDPRISFGAPTVGGIPTWIIKGRWNAGESDTDIAEDFGLEKEQVRKALDFEGVGSRKGKAKSRTH
jgi:uncharacterized protein (DUF433 family)